jgi:hypothetical protein
MEILALILTYIILLYLDIVLLFGIYFFIRGAAQIDKQIKNSPWTLRLLLVPGAIGLWPLLFLKLVKPSKTNV